MLCRKKKCRASERGRVEREAEKRGRAGGEKREGENIEISNEDREIGSGSEGNDWRQT